MNIETKRLILRDLVEQYADALLEKRNNEQVIKHPFFKGDETIDFIRIMIAFFQSVREKGIIIDNQYPKGGHLQNTIMKCIWTGL